MQLQEHTAVHDESVPAGPAPPRVHTQRVAKPGWRYRLGDSEGNAILTTAPAAVLTILFVAEGITIVRMGARVSAHMFIGMLLIPPVLLKLASTGYRFVR